MSSRGIALGFLLAGSLLTVSVLAGACSPLSRCVEDPAAGFNGGFEQVRDGLPLNWSVYAPETVPEGRFRIVLDPRDPREGRQSLCFEVESCSADGGWRSPGLFRELPAEPGATYRIRFWIRSRDCAWSARARGVAPKTGAPVELLASSVDASADWRLVEREVTVPAPNEHLRFELSITSPGSLWIDDVSIVRLRGADAGGATPDVERL